MTPEKLVTLGNDLATFANWLSEVATELKSVGCSGNDGDNSAAETEKKSPAPESQEPKTVTLEDVRAVLAAKSGAGLTAQVKTLITKYGAEKLSDVAESNYAALLAEAEGIK